MIPPIMFFFLKIVLAIKGILKNDYSSIENLFKDIKGKWLKLFCPKVDSPASQNLPMHFDFLGLIQPTTERPLLSRNLFNSWEEGGI